MEVKSDFYFKPVPAITGYDATKADVLGPLADLPGTWTGKGFNVIWRPHHDKNQDHFLELNLTSETLEFQEIGGPIPNRGLLQHDICMFGAGYLQQIKDANNQAGLHFEPGIWANVPKTENPKEQATVVRMASIPHGTTVLAQGLSLVAPKPDITPTGITPFKIGDPKSLVHFPESDLSKKTKFRSPPADIAGITQKMVDDPNSVLTDAIKGQKIKSTIVLIVSSDPNKPVVGGGTVNTAFLEGSKSGPNAQAALVTATFWIETVEGAAGRPDFLQLQYTQTVLLNFNGLSWPHITVGTLLKG